MVLALIAISLCIDLISLDGDYWFLGSTFATAYFVVPGLFLHLNLPNKLRTHLLAIPFCIFWWAIWIVVRSLMTGDGDCQDTRAEILIRDSQQPVRFKSSGQCEVSSGMWTLPYMGGSESDAAQLDIDHVIPLKWAHGHGGDRWTLSQKQVFANDSDNLQAVYFSANRSKGAKGPDDWMPVVNRCRYAERWEYLLNKYQLGVLPVESATLVSVCQ